MRSRAKPDGPTVAVLAVAAAAWLAAAPVRAETVYDLSPAASFGVTDNARLGPIRLRDEFIVLEAATRLRYLGANSNHAIGYRLAWTHYLEGNGLDNLSNELLAASNLNPTARLELHLTATATLSRVSRIVLGSPGAAIPPQGVVGGTNLFLMVGAAEEAVYRPSARWQYLETFGATRITYLDSPAPPDGLTFTGRARADLTTGLDSYSLEASSFLTISAINTVSAQLMAGRRREFSLTWTGEIQVGAMAIFRSTGSPVYGPAGNAVLTYRRITWFAILTVSRVPTPNLFLGEPTVNNQAFIRLTLPLTRDESAVVSAMAGYLYANPANDQFARAYDQRSAGAMVGSRLGQLPLYASLDYTILSQHNNPDVPTPAPNLFRQVLMLNLRASFTFGPGTPPILGAAM